MQHEESLSANNTRQDVLRGTCLQPGRVLRGVTETSVQEANQPIMILRHEQQGPPPLKCEFNLCAVSRDTLPEKRLADTIEWFIRKLCMQKTHPAQSPVTPRVLILDGPPGTGKTTIANIIATESRYRLGNFVCTNFINSWKDSGPQYVTQLFKQATDLKEHCIILINEIDGITKKDSKNHEIDNMGNAINQEIDKLDQEQNPYVYVILTTNHYDNLPESLKDRADRHTFELPDKFEIQQMIEFYLSAKNYFVDDEQLDLLTDHLAKKQVSKRSLKYLIYDLMDKTRAIEIERKQHGQKTDSEDHFKRVNEQLDLLNKQVSKYILKDMIYDLIDKTNAKKGLKPIQRGQTTDSKKDLMRVDDSSVDFILRKQNFKPDYNKRAAWLFELLKNEGKVNDKLIEDLESSLLYMNPNSANREGENDEPWDERACREADQERQPPITVKMLRELLRLTQDATFDQMQKIIRESLAYARRYDQKRYYNCGAELADIFLLMGAYKVLLDIETSAKNNRNALQLAKNSPAIRRRIFHFLLTKSNYKGTNVELLMASRFLAQATTGFSISEIEEVLSKAKNQAAIGYGQLLGRSDILRNEDLRAGLYLMRLQCLGKETKSVTYKTEQHYDDNLNNRAEEEFLLNGDVDWADADDIKACFSVCLADVPIALSKKFIHRFAENYRGQDLLKGCRLSPFIMTKIIEKAKKRAEEHGAVTQDDICQAAFDVIGFRFGNQLEVNAWLKFLVTYRHDIALFIQATSSLTATTLSVMQLIPSPSVKQLKPSASQAK